ncbi:tRNA-specific adenosine deaminase [Bordetella genomosp. 7]|uniref:tRNA-specific adenosine deaminase n=1 Tax=Bordetella genomosp. 7 TaxID=1416805 RepID=A0A261REP3_9BORD|nr:MULTISPECIES: nucleoside deaminase [Bordetella]OZI22803.1 tRNA-specific adenosine deaminase [Bordetella genomosp. 7]OZI25601.1 tRNA-specific adenosine deaminase [Bordetella genomosp. 7]
MNGQPQELILKRMQETVELSLRQVDRGGIPFAAMVLDVHGRVLGSGVNQVREHHDPTAHAEVQAMRNACARAGATRLPGTILLASGEPCALCYLAALYAGVTQIWFAASRDEAAAHGFDYRDTYRIFAHDPLDWPAAASARLAVPPAHKPFHAHRARGRAP